MNTIQSELESAVLSPEYFYILEKPSLLSRAIKKIFEIYCKILFKIYCPLKVKGKENIPGSSFIFCSNHNSHMDSGVLIALIIAIPVIIFPAAFIWYINIGGVTKAYKQAKASNKARVGE